MMKMNDEDVMKRNGKKDQFMARKPTAAPEEEAQPASAGKKTKEKRKRVVRDRLSEKLIGIMIVHSSPVYDIPDERLAQYCEEFHATYAERKAHSEKRMAEEQSLIDQYLIHGYAEFVWEVTDDDDDGGDTAEVDGSKEG